MKIVAAVFADFEQTLLGGPSQLQTQLGARSIIAHTLRRVARIADVEQRCLYVRPRDADAGRAALTETGIDGGAIELLPHDDGRRPRRELVRAARKWNLHAWRGAPLGMTYFDEYVEPAAAARVLDHYQADALLCLDGHAPLLDTDIAGRMLAHLRENPADALFVITQAPPGVAGIVLTRAALRILLDAGAPVGVLLGYRPEAPRADPIARAECVRLSADVTETQARLTGDTRRSRELIASALPTLDQDAAALDVCRHVRTAGDAAQEPSPLELELELTTADPLPETTLRPRGPRTPERRLVNLDAVSRLAEQLAAYDDGCIVLAGHGDPLLHPDFAEVCRRIRAAGVCGLAVITPLVELSETHATALFDHRVDLVEVQLDAHSPETYRQVHQAGHFERVRANIERLRALRRDRNSAQPLVAPSLTRCSQTLAEIEPFFDHWTAATGAGVLHGHNDFCGRITTDSLLTLSPPVRTACRRLGRRLTLLADGAVARCQQDVNGEFGFGNWIEQPLEAVWRGQLLRELREAHERGAFDRLDLCRACSEWFRP